MKMKPTLLVLALTASTWGLAPLAHAQMAPPGKEATMNKVDEVMKALDKNGDGMIDREEAKAEPSIDKNFVQINTSGSGKITKEELAAWMSRK
ncbi:MAG: EF-hand domain-containing protein [Betaproteobacteria bacterium]|nr:EF-hand domain-containing protein [Betaproteobacteria bacterium]MDE2048126.1 EF-hand domain-containing protein [Betaproteobacteria bacterium]